MSPESTIDVKNLCSRKLWEILIVEQNQSLSCNQRSQIEQELIIRRHYLQELAKLGRQIH